MKKRKQLFKGQFVITIDESEEKDKLDVFSTNSPFWRDYFTVVDGELDG